jgi:predicted nucleotidyltransferase
MPPILKTYKNAIAEICKSLGIKRMHVFGSMARNNYNSESDIDFLISFEDGLSTEEYSENYFTLHRKLRKLLKREVDIITERSLSNPYFIGKIENDRLLVFECSSI